MNVNLGSGFWRLKPPLSQQNRPASVRHILPLPESASADFALLAANLFARLLNRTDVRSIAIAKTIRTLNLSPAERDAINRVCPVECLVLTEVTTAIAWRN
ncbi:hypothetical protein H6G89_26095 [Oscillatoria sp. FACHB-1407]|uniref:hypothetical protein n=1 Tax=Oscillatoria sp. FACHB-1407 TaxID=2692847 RepID=UPI001689A671|nr:hypothetical protein [Oscillatoria sp. FACHB-1407]MBD2464482.1 hypothetical protein [Oscillatoria sp. FACHB-1407]